MAVLTTRDNVRHRLVSQGEAQEWGKRRHGVFEHTFDPRIGKTACGLRVAMIGGPCPPAPGHRIAVPACPMHEPPTPCQRCYP